MYVMFLILILLLFHKKNVNEPLLNFPKVFNIGFLVLDSILPYTRSEIQIYSYQENDQTHIPKNFVFKQLVRENPNIFKSTKLPIIPPSSYNKFITTYVPTYAHCIMEIFQSMSLQFNYKFRYFIYTDVHDMQFDLIDGKIQFMIAPNYKDFLFTKTFKIQTLGTLFNVIPICINCKNKKYYQENLLALKKNSFSFYLLDTNYNFKYFFNTFEKDNFVQYYVLKSNKSKFIPINLYATSPLNEKLFLPKSIIDKVQSFLANMYN